MKNISNMNGKSAGINMPSKTNGAYQKGSGRSFLNAANTAKGASTLKDDAAKDLVNSLANTAKMLDSPAKARAFFSDASQKKAVMSDLDSLNTYLQGDTSLDKLADLPARDLTIVRGLLAVATGKSSEFKIRMDRG